MLRTIIKSGQHSTIKIKSKNYEGYSKSSINPAYKDVNNSFWFKKF